MTDPLAEVVDLAREKYRALIGKRCTLTFPDGRTITGKVLRTKEGADRFRFRAREMHYVLMDMALALRVAAAPPMKSTGPPKRKAPRG